MLEDVEFIVGDREALRGRCIVYTENLGGSENPFNPRYPALAVASDPSELLTLLSALGPIPDNFRDAILERIRQSADIWSKTMFGSSMYRFVREMMSKKVDQLDIPKELLEEVRAAMDSIPEEETGVPFHGCFLPIVGFDPGVIEPYQQLCDVVKAPPVPSITYGGLVLSGHAQHYLAQFYLQKEASPAGDEGDEAESGAANPTEGDAVEASGHDFIERLTRKINQIMFAKETGDSIEPHVAELQRLTRGTVFVRDAQNISSIIRSEHPAKMDLLELYLKRTILLVDEKYEEIPELDLKIKSISGG